MRHQFQNRRGDRSLTGHRRAVTYTINQWQWQWFAACGGCYRARLLRLGSPADPHHQPTGGILFNLHIAATPLLSDPQQYPFGISMVGSTESFVKRAAVFCLECYWYLANKNPCSRALISRIDNLVLVQFLSNSYSTITCMMFFVSRQINEKKNMNTRFAHNLFLGFIDQVDFALPIYSCCHPGHVNSLFFPNQ